jgi:hypothetical protein
MPVITVRNRIPSDGNPDGIVYAPKNSLFYKSDEFYYISYSGSRSPSAWETVEFSPTTIPSLLKTTSDVELLSRVETGSFLYVKTTAGTLSSGWELLTTKSLFTPK